jgi:hypothetical protein
VAKPLWEGLQVFVSVFEEFAAERTDRGREKKKRSVGSISTELSGVTTAVGLTHSRVCNTSSPPQPLMSLSPRSSPVPLQSIPPSPDEQDLGGNAPWHSDDEFDHRSVSTAEHSLNSKGKAPLYANGATDELSPWPDPTRSTGAYPPTTDEEADTLRVQEVRACSPLAPIPDLILGRT